MLGSTTFQGPTFPISMDLCSPRKQKAETFVTILKMIQVTTDGDISSEKYDLWLRDGVRPYLIYLKVLRCPQDTNGI